MDLYVVKVKDKDLFFNANDMMGEYICDFPLVVDKETADNIMKFAPSIMFYEPIIPSHFNDTPKNKWTPEDVEKIHIGELEIKKIKIVYE